MAKVTKINELSGQIDTLTLGLASRVQKDFNLAKNIRILQDECHVQNIRDYIGQYAPDVKFRDGQSKVFVKLCRTKVAAAQARLIALAFPPTGFPWSLKPSPEPELYGEEHIQTPAGEIADKGVPGKEDSDEHEQLELHIARVKADRMRRKIHYALVCGDWETTEASGILDLVLHGTMIFRGPLKKCKEGVKYQFVEESGLKAALKRLFRKPVGGKWEGKVEKEYYPGSDWISVFDFYPEPMSKDANDMQWGIVRHVMDRSQVIGLKEIDGFDAEEIDIALRNNPKGNWVAQPWESQINVLHNKSGSMNLGERFEVLEWRGKLTGRDIRMAGGNISDEKLNVAGYGCIWAIGNHAISMSISEAVPTRLPFYIVPYERVPYKIWGQGIAEMMRDSQAIINAATRAMVDNMGMASGPQIVADLSRLANPNDANKVAPWKVWAVKNMDGVTGDPVKFQVVPSIIGDLEKVQNIFRAFAQEETSMPDMLHGGVGPGGSGVRTIGQTQMLFGAADTFTKSVYFNIDNYLTKPMIRDYYNWYMQNYDDDSIKGDMVVEVGGMLGAIEKELRAQTLSEIMQYTQEGSPFAIAMNKSEIISELLRSRDLVNEAFVYPEEVVERKIKEQQQMQQQQEMQMQQMQGAMQQQAAKLQQDAMMEKQDAEHRFKAETTKNDTLLNVFDKTPPNSPVYPELMAMTLEANGMLDEDARVAINVMRRVVASTYSAYMTDQEKEIMTGGGPAPKPPEPAPEDNPKTAVKPGMGASAGNENPLLPEDMSTYSLPTAPPGGPAAPKGAQEAKRQIIPVMDGNGRVVGSRVE